MSGARQRPIPYQRLIYQLAPLEHAPLPANYCGLHQMNVLAPVDD
jgi:hypothetical protein